MPDGIAWRGVMRTITTPPPAGFAAWTGDPEGMDMSARQPVTLSPVRRGRGRPKRFDGIVADLVAEIAAGRMVPGQRIQARREMALRYDATIVTVQKALAELEAAGIVRSEGWQGTFVCDHPPCLRRFGLLLPDLPGSEGGYTSRFHGSLSIAAVEHGRRDGCEWIVYDGLLAGGKALKKLRADLAGHRLAGLVAPFVRPLRPLIGDLLAYRVPLVQIGGAVPDPGCHHLDFDRRHLNELAARRLLAAGSRQPMVAVLANTASAHFSGLVQTLERMGISLAPGAVMGFDAAYAGWIGQWMAGQLAQPRARRPDGLLIMDDNFIDAAQEGLSGLTIAAGRELPVVAYVNLPYQRMPEGFLGIGCDSTVILEMAREELQGLRRGEIPPARLIPMTELPA